MRLWGRRAGVSCAAAELPTIARGTGQLLTTAPDVNLHMVYWNLARYWKLARSP
jgi:hypothetical protein